MASPEDHCDFPLNELYERLNDPIRRGSYGTVYKYMRKDRKFNDKIFPFAIAVKEIPHQCDEVEADKHLQREYDILMQNPHPNIVQFFGRSKTDKTTWFVMELCNTDLKKLKNQRKFIRTEIAAILWQILLALDHLHKRHIMHRDIKPGNILIKSDREITDLRAVSVGEMTVKLCDFGLARDYVANKSKTAHMTTAGTLSYAAPEIRQNLGPQSDYVMAFEDLSVSRYTESCDIFSAAVVAFELYTGKLESDVTSYTDFTRLESCLGIDCDLNLLSLLKCMLHSNKRRRNSAAELLNHNFIQQGKLFFQNEQKIYKLSKQVETLENSEKVLKNALAESKVTICKLKKDLTVRTRQRDQCYEKAAGLIKDIHLRDQEIEKFEREHKKPKEESKPSQNEQHSSSSHRNDNSRSAGHNIRDLKSPAIEFIQGWKEKDKITADLQLWEATQDEDLTSMNQALKSGANIVYQQRFIEYYGWVNALHLAAYYGHILATNLLLTKGADIDSVTYGEQWTALIIASMNRHYQVVELLLKNGANVDLRNLDGWTALHWASNNEDYSMCKLLVQTGKASVNTRDKEGRTPLGRARGGHIAEYLCKNGATL